MRLFGTKNTRTFFGGVFCCVLVLLASGCGPDYKARGAVKGKVTTGKKALTTGTVIFVNKDGVSASAHIDPQGNYDMQDAPLGECTVTVIVDALPSDPSVRARLKGGGPKMPGELKNPEDTGPPPPPGGKIPKEVVPIDGKYAKPDTSGLTTKVEKGEQIFNIDL